MPTAPALWLTGFFVFPSFVRRGKMHTVKRFLTLCVAFSLQWVPPRFFSPLRHRSKEVAWDAEKNFTVVPILDGDYFSMIEQIAMMILQVSSGSVLGVIRYFVETEE